MIFFRLYPVYGLYDGVSYGLWEVDNNRFFRFNTEYGFIGVYIFIPCGTASTCLEIVSKQIYTVIQMCRLEKGENKFKN